MDTTYKLIGTKLYVVQTQEAEVIDFADISEATLIYIQPELLDSYKVLNPDYSALMKPYSYTVISSKAPAWNDEPGPGPEPPTPVKRFMSHIIPAYEFGMGEDDQRHIAFWNETRNIGHGEVYNNTSNAQYYEQDYGSDPDYDNMPTWHVARGDRMFAALDDAGDQPNAAKVIHAWYDRDNTRGIETSDTIKEQNGYWFQTMEFEIGEGHSYPGVYFTIPEEFAEEDFIFIINANAIITQTIQNWPEGCRNNVMIDQWYGSNDHNYYWIPEGIRWSHDNRRWPEEYKSLDLSFHPVGEYHTTGGWLGGPIIVQPSTGLIVSVVIPSEARNLQFTDNPDDYVQEDVQLTQGTFTGPLQSWTSKSDREYTSGAVFGIGSGLTLAGFACPETNPSGNREGAVLGIAAAWSQKCYYAQAMHFAPGTYTLRGKVYNTATGGHGAAAPRYIESSLFGFSQGENRYVSNVTFYDRDVWTEVSATMEVTEECDGYITVGHQAKQLQSSDNAKLFYFIEGLDYVAPAEPEEPTDTAHTEDPDNPGHNLNGDDMAHTEDPENPGNNLNGDDMTHTEDPNNPGYNLNGEDMTHTEDPDNPVHNLNGTDMTEEDPDNPGHDYYGNELAGG